MLVRLVASLSICSLSPALPHGGGLNSQGCHNEYARGSYHCHRVGRDGRTEQPSPRLKGPSAETNGQTIKYIPYSRNLYFYRSYPTDRSVGFYTGLTCPTNIDHVVSLKDAHESGAFAWSASQRSEFANDRSNHVPTCKRINSSKGSSTPKDFFRKSNDGRGMEYKIQTRCAYVGIYFQVKKKYHLTFANNSSDVFAQCGIAIE